MSNLFVTDEDIEMAEANQDSGTQDPEANDPIVEEIPVYLNQIDSELSVCVFQYISQLASRPFTLENAINIKSTRTKPNAQTVEIDIPLDTSRFFDQDKASAWNSMTAETYGGNLNEIKGSHVVCIRDGAMGKEAILTPVSKVCQLRPAFHHIDDLDEEIKSSKEQELAADVDTEKMKPKSVVQVVQMTAKSSGSENEIRYSGAIHSFKQFKTEEYVPCAWNDESSEASLELKKKLYGTTEALQTKLEVKESYNEYTDRLLR